MKGKAKRIGSDQPVTRTDPVEQAEDCGIATQQQVVAVVDRAVQNGIMERAAAATGLPG